MEPIAGEDEIAALLDRGDHRGAVSATLAAYGPAILGYLDAVVHDPDDAAEVYATFCLNLWRGIDGFRRACSMKTWAYKLAWNAAMHFLTSPQRRRVRRLRTSEVSRIAAAQRSTSSAHNLTERKQHLRRLREQLDPDEQALLVLRIDRAMAWNEIATVMARDGESIDAAALRKRFERLKLRLRALAREQRVGGHP